MPPQDRTAWIGDLEVRILQPGDEVDVVFFVGCAGAFDDRNQKVTRSFARLLNKLGVDYGILGLDENCCGETARRMGNEYLFQVYAEENITALNKIKFNTIVTQCPHGYNTLKHEYPVFGGHYNVIHSSEYLVRLLAERDLPRSGELELGRLTYHDSCYMGRFNDIYDEPRTLLKKANLNVLEMEDHHEKSFCCGGGGGAMWLETEAETRINQTRLDHAKNIKADTIATACPYCLIMMDDAIRSKGLTGDIQVYDISEILDLSME
jgi:Fe-S oxidoreductase